MTSEYRALALHLRGLYKPDGKVHFKAGRISGAFWTESPRPQFRGAAHLVYGWRPKHRLFLRPEGFFDPIAKGLGLQDLQVGDARFDKAFLIQGDPPRTALRALSPQVQSLVLRLSKLARGSGPTLQINESGTSFKLSRDVSPDHWKDLVDLGNAIMREFTPLAIEEPCSRCDKPILGRSRRCRSCESRYHRKCWEEQDGCECS